MNSEEMTEYRIRPIAKIRTDLSTKFGLPRQSNVVPELWGKIVFQPEYRDPEALRGIQEYSHLWLIWQFSEHLQAGWSPTVRPPVLGGNKHMGVFATRSPFRPNFLALSCVKLEKLEEISGEGTVLWVSGVDMVDRTPIFDIKPYIPKWDSIPGARQGFTGEHERRLLDVKREVDLPPEFTKMQCVALVKLLQQDPRPAYHRDPKRIYGITYGGYDVRFQVEKNILTILGCFKIEK